MKFFNSLSLKWRPKFFNDFVGHKFVIKILINSLKLNKIHNCYLFYGSYGVGKTSLARIFSKGLNCINGITNLFCGKCLNCLNIDLGKSCDVIEIDAASRTKVEDIKEILDKVYYLPISMRYKIYIIDEVHMLSRYSFNALLKILEETPNHVKFIFATTEINKIPDTILSRCMSFNLKPLSKIDIFNRLHYIINKEKIFISKNSINIISSYSKGSMRNALILLDQLILFNNGFYISNNSVYLLLDIVHDKWIFLFMKYLFLKDNKIFYFLNKLNNLNINYYNFISSLLDKLYILLFLIIFPKNLNNLNKFYEKKSLSIFIRFKKYILLNDLIFYYKIFLYCQEKILLYYNKKIIFDFYVLKSFIYKNNSFVIK